MRGVAFGIGALFCCLFAAPAQAWWDTQIERLGAYPLVQAVEAERAVPESARAAVLADTAAFGDQAVRADARRPRFSMVFTGLRLGCYGLFVNARAEAKDIDSVRRPVYVDLRVDSGPAGEWRHYRARVGYSVRYEAVAQIYFMAEHAGDYHVEVSLSAESQAPLIIDRFELRNPLGDAPMKRIKHGPTRSRPEERRRLWLAVQQGAPRYKYPLAYFNRSSQMATHEERLKRDAQIWNAFPPINTPVERMRYPGSRKLLATIAAALDIEAKHGSWEPAETSHQNMYDWDLPLTLVNRKLSLAYTVDDLRQGRALPAPWPWPDAGWGWFLDRDVVRGQLAPERAKIIDNHVYYEPIAGMVSQRYESFERAIGGRGYPWPALADRYHCDRDLDAARDGAFALCVYAYHYPAMNARPLTLGMIDSPQDLGGTPRFGPSNAGYGKSTGYSCTAEHTFQQLCAAYDRLFDFIDGNQELADSLGRFIPWIKTPDDVLVMLDNYLVYHGFVAMQNMRLRCGQGGWEQAMAETALVLGPSPEGERAWQALFTRAYMDSTNSGGFQDHLVCSYSRDGINYMGSVPYSSGSCLAALEISQKVRRFVELGGRDAYGLSDPQRYPRLVEAVWCPLLLAAPGGFEPMIGDAGDLNRGRIFNGVQGSREVYRLGLDWTRAPEFAWMLANVYGREDESDDAWAAITAAAARTRDPRLYMGSRTLAGFGMTMLVDGQDSPDFRFKRTLLLRSGIARGHAHPDSLNLELYALGCRMAPDLGGRHEGNRKAHPNMTSSRAHNLVEIDGKSFFSVAGNGTGCAWLDAFRPADGCGYAMGSGRAKEVAGVTLYRRAVAEIAVDEGREGKPPAEAYGPNVRHDRDIVFPASYVFDVFRVAGGHYHTWCFHGAHSQDEQQPDGRVLPALDINTEMKPASSPEATKYLADFRAGTQREGAGPDRLVATWRLDRTREKGYLGVDFNPDGPRKYTRIILLGHGGDRVLAANAWSKDYNYDYPFLYVQTSRDGGERESVYPAVIEAYAGEPAVKDAKLLAVADNETDARRAVAVEVTTTNGRNDLCFSDERSDKLRQVEGGVRVAAEFAYLSRDEGGARLFRMVGGTRFEAPDFRVEVDQAAHIGHILSMDPARREVQLDAD